MLRLQVEQNDIQARALVEYPIFLKIQSHGESEKPIYSTCKYYS